MELSQGGLVRGVPVGRQSEADKNRSTSFSAPEVELSHDDSAADFSMRPPFPLQRTCRIRTLTVDLMSTRPCKDLCLPSGPSAVASAIFRPRPWVWALVIFGFLRASL